MNQPFNYYFIKTLHRKFRLPRTLVYSISRRFISKNRSHQANKIARIPNTPPADFIPQSSGFKLFQYNEIPNSNSLVAECNAIFNKCRQNYNDQYFLKNPKKRFLLTIASNEDLLNNIEIKKFLKSDFVNNNVSSYFNHPYVLSTVRLWWTPLNNTSISSQKFHLDEEDLTQMKVFVNISEVTQHHGPFTFLSGEASAKILSKFRNGKRRFSDEEIFKHIPKDELVELTGNAGSGAFVDTSKCLHYGSRSNTNERLVLMAQFLKLNAPLLTHSLHL